MYDIIYNQYFLFNNNCDREILTYLIINNIIVYSQIDNELYNINDNINIKNIVWYYDINNIRTPYILNNKIKYYKLKDTDNIYNFISSNLLIDYQQVITGEKIQTLADIIVGDESSLNWNSNNIFFSKKMCSINNLSSINNYNSIFVFTHDLEKFYNKFKNQLENKIIISHNSDHEINYIQNVKLHLAQNCLIKNEKLFAIPIGIENNQWFDHQIFNNVRNMKIKKTKDIYFYFNLDTYTTRSDCYNQLKNKLVWNTKKNKKDYFIELANHRYAICPRGNGLDTHRIWECLYLDVIPIIIKDDYINIDNLPIIILNSWTELNLIDKFKNVQLEKLTIEHYNYKILNSIIK